jgi:hypothetical protein
LALTPDDPSPIGATVVVATAAAAVIAEEPSLSPPTFLVPALKN